MGTENQTPANFPFRPPASPFATTQSTTPFLSSNPVAGPNALPFRPALATTSQAAAPFVPSVPRVGVRPPSISSARPTYGPPTTGPFQGFPTPQSSMPNHMPPPRMSSVGQSNLQPPSNPSVGISSQPPLVPPVPMGSPQSLNSMPSSVNVPRSSGEMVFSATRPNLQPSSPPMGPSYPVPQVSSHPSFPGYPSKQPNVVMQAPPLQSSAFSAQEGGYVPYPQTTRASFLTNQGGYVHPPPTSGSPTSYSREQIQQPGPPPKGPVYGLAEAFNSLSVGSVSGSFDGGVDPKFLPRPLDGDMEPISLAEAYPMNCSSRFLRLTTSGIPNSQSLASRWHLTLGAVVCPLAEAPEGEEVPVVNFATTGIIRCKRCRTYVNPYVTFAEGGRRWRCNICSLLNDVPGDYFSHLDATGRRIDLDQRPELTKGSVEFVAPAEYMVRPPMPPLYFFVIDVSTSLVGSGMLEVLAQTIKSSLDNLPGSPRTQIGFITFDSTIHFYNMKSSLTQPQMMVVSDLDDIFVPLPDDLLVNLSESRTVVDAFLDSLPSMFQDNMNVESAFGPALKAAYMVMSRLGGKLLIFQNSLPSIGVGRLRLRGDDHRVYGTDKEHMLRIPEDPFYKQMAADFTKYQIAVNVYACSDKYTDIASLGTLAKYTGGQVYYYPSFQSALHKDKLRFELARDLTRETAWEAVMRIRCGKGVRFTTYHGNFMLRSTDLLALPAVDCDKAYAMQLSLEESLMTTQTVYFQVALLYTSSSGERRIRVHTAAAPVVSDLGEMYRLADIGAIVSIFCRLAIEKTLSYKLEDARNSVQLRIVKALREYRNLYAVQHRLGGRLIYPESLKFLPLYGLAICKSMALRGGFPDATLDERCSSGFTMMALPVKKLLKLLYPNLMRMDEYLVNNSSHSDLDINEWKRLPLSLEALDSRGLYIYDDGFRFIIWFGRMLSPDLARDLLGEDFAMDYSRVSLHERETETSKRLMRTLKKFRECDPSYYQLCHLVRQGEQPREGFLLLTNLLEDQNGGANSYVDWILQIHKQVQQNA